MLGFQPHEGSPIMPAMLLFAKARAHRIHLGSRPSFLFQAAVARHHPVACCFGHALLVVEQRHLVCCGRIYDNSQKVGFLEACCMPYDDPKFMSKVQGKQCNAVTNLKKTTQKLLQEYWGITSPAGVVIKSLTLEKVSKIAESSRAIEEMLGVNLSSQALTLETVGDATETILDAKALSNWRLGSPSGRAAGADVERTSPEGCVDLLFACEDVRLILGVWSGRERQQPRKKIVGDSSVLTIARLLV